MAKQLVAQPLPNFGVNGLNTQSNPNSLDPSYLTSADNIVLRESGRISFRKGLKQKVVPSGTSINSIVEHNDQGTNKIFASHGTSIYTIDFTTPNAAFPSSGADVKHTVANTTGDWQFINFNSRLHCFHKETIPQRYDGSYPSNEKWSSTYHTDAINLANGSEVTAPNVVANKTYKITALGNTNWSLLSGDTSKEAEIGDIFTSIDVGSTATSTSATAPNMVSGNRYKIIALGDTDFNLNGADSSPAVGEIFTANDILGIGTGLVAEVISGSTGTVVEIKTNSTLTTITVDDTTNFPSTGKIIIGEEIISYTGKTSTTFTGCIRGSSNTTATYHLDNAVVKNDFSPLSVTEGEFKPSCGTGAYGRIWAGGVEEEKDVLHYSSILDGDDFTLYSGGGSIDLKKVWDKDDIIAIAPFYGQLAVFGKNNIAIYESPDVIGNIRLNEVIKGIGCVARDSVQAIGDDLVFLSNTGLRSLARTSEKDKVPLTDISKNIKDTIIRNIGISDLTKIKSVYVENEGIYILSFTDKNINYVFDFKHFTPNGEPRITTWTFDNDREPASMCYTETYGYITGQKDGGIAGYEGYFDTDMSFSSGSVVLSNSGITADVSSIWIPLSQGAISSLLKRMILVLEGGSGSTLGLKWYKDFGMTPSETTQISLRPATTGTVALYGAVTSLYGANTTYDYGGVSYCTIGQHNTQATCEAAGGTWTTISNTGAIDQPPNASSSPAKYSPIYGLQEYSTPLAGSAKTLKLNMSIVSNGYNASIQDLSILHLQGKIR